MTALALASGTRRGHVDFTRLEGTCDFAITNGNHGCTLRFLMQRIPVLAIPLFIEQRLNGIRLEEHQFGLTIPASEEISLTRLQHLVEQLDQRRENLDGLIAHSRSRLDRVDVVYDRIRAELEARKI